MATQLFFRHTYTYPSPIETNLAVPEAHVSGATYTKLDGSTGLNENLAWATQWYLSTTRGSSGSNYTVYTVAGPTNGVEGWLFATAPVASDVTISGSITFNWRGYESSMSANAAANFRVMRSSPDGSLTEIHKTVRTTEMPTSDNAANWAETPASGVTLYKGDRLVVIPFIDDAGTMNSGYYVYMGWNGLSGAVGDSYITFTETISFETDPSGTTIYPTSDTLDIDPGSASELNVWKTRGSGVATSVTSTTTGYTSGVQITATAGGTALEWYTPPLQPMSLSGPVLVNTRDKRLTGSTSYSGFRCEIAITDEDGTSPVVWGTNGTRMITAGDTTESGRQYWVTGHDTSITSGQRIRIRLYLDDANGVMVSGSTLAVYYAGASGATGDTYLTFPITLYAGTVTEVFTLDAVIFGTISKTFTLDALISYFNWTEPPADEAQISPSTALTFYAPIFLTGPIKFQVQLDTANTFDTGDLVTYGLSDGTWEYYDGADWAEMPVTGLSSAYVGTRCRFTPPSLANGTWYRRVRYTKL